MKDLSGQRFGRLVVIEKTEERNRGSVVWRCLCDCGKECLISSASLKKGRNSCGCLRKEILSRKIKEQKPRLTHGMKHTKDYYRWSSMKDRCHNPNCKGFKDYGGRGIKVCDEWYQDFQSYYDYVSKLPHYGEEGYSLDRIDNDGNYEPGNVRWATRRNQNLNRRDSIRYEIKGQKLNVIELSELLNIPTSTLYCRRQKHKPILKNEEKEKLLVILSEI